MTVQLTGNYGQAGDRDPRGTDRLVADGHLSTQDLLDICASVGQTDGILTSEALVQAGFTRGDARQIMLALENQEILAGAHVKQADGSVRTEIQIGSKDAWPGLDVSLTNVAGFDPIGASRLNFASPSATARIEPAHWGSVTLDERRAHLQVLQQEAMTLSKDGTSGVALWSQITDRAIELYKGEALSPEQLSDMVMGDLAIVLVGPSAGKFLNWYDTATDVAAGGGGGFRAAGGAGMPADSDDPLVGLFQGDFALLGLDPDDEGASIAAGYAGGYLDSTHASDFRPEISDGSTGQITHTFFYQFMTYATNAPSAVAFASLGHEMAADHGGNSVEDHHAALVAIGVGGLMRAERDRGGSTADWPAMVQAAYGTGGAAGQSSPAAQKADEVARQVLAEGAGLEGTAIKARIAIGNVPAAAATHLGNAIEGYRAAFNHYTQ